MKYFIILFFSLFILSASAHAQEKYKKHKVEKGETITDIAKKYKVTPYDIYRLNPDSQNGIQENTILLVPSQPLAVTVVPEKEKTTKVSNPVHVVEAKETLYSLSKKYSVSVEDITKANAETLKEGLQIGQKIIIPVKGSGVEAQAKIAEKQGDKKNAPSYLFHTVAPGETKYSIAKQYGMSLQLLEELNPEVKDTLPVGAKLKLSKNALLKKELGPIVQEKDKASDFVVYTVQPKETLYSLMRATGVTEEELTGYNSELKNGLREGMQLRFPADKFILSADGTKVIRKGYEAPGKAMADLTKTLKKTGQKEIALLLPFNMDRIGNDSIRTHRLRNDKFLNMTLDFYAGALMAIDSAATLGLPIKVRVLDSEETKNSSAVASLRSTLTTADAIIGPFYQDNVEKTAAMFTKEVPVISPLSKEAGAPYTNLFQSVPSPNRVKMAMIDYLKGKDGNVVAVVESKKASSRDFIKTNYPLARFLEGGVTEGSMKAMLVPDKMNYVILETESTTMILNTTKVLTALMPDYRIQLVVLEKYDAFDNDEIPLARLTGLKMLYPSVTKGNSSPEAAIFEKNFKKKNNIFPNQFATRGFDVTFDVILRLFQEEGFVSSIDTKASEQIENKFDYELMNGGTFNNGVYILQYNEDLSLTQAE